MLPWKRWNSSFLFTVIYGHADIFLSNARCSNSHPGTEGLPRTGTTKRHNSNGTSQKVQCNDHKDSKFFASLSAVFDGAFVPVGALGNNKCYSSVEMFQHIPPTNNMFYGVILSECLGTFAVFLCETVFLFSLPLYKSGQISSQLSRLIFTVTTLDSEDQRRRGFALNTEQKIVLFAGLLERHQRYGNVGFKVAGLHITQLKSVWLTLLGPVFAFVGNVLLKENF